MKLLIGSDLHLEHKGQQELPELPEYDVAILAGDIGNGTKGFEFAQSFFPADKPVLYITGNHEYYGHDYLTVYLDIRILAEQSKNVHFIDGGTTTIDGVKFIGANLWTSFRLEGYQAYAFDAFRKAISDFAVIRVGERLFNPIDAAVLFDEHSKYIQEQLELNKDGKNIVVTHFMPSQEVISNFWRGNNLNPYFCNDMDYLITKYNPDAWIYGHTHDKGDKIHSSGKTRLVSNPRGYPGFEQKGKKFQWKIIEL